MLKTLYGSDRLAFILDQHACIHMDKLMERVTMHTEWARYGVVGAENDITSFLNMLMMKNGSRSVSYWLVEKKSFT